MQCGSVDEKSLQKNFSRSDAFVTTRVGLSGADSGRFVQGIVDLSGNGYPGGDIVTWQFPAPPYDVTHFEHGITGPDHADVPGVPRDRPCSRRWRHIDTIGCRTRSVIRLQASSHRPNESGAAQHQGINESQLPFARRAPRIRPV